MRIEFAGPTAAASFVGVIALLLYHGCVAAARTGDGDRTVKVEPPPPFVGPPAPVEINQDSLAGQIAAKLEARLQVMLNAVANVASGNTTYFSWAVAGVMGIGWLVQARSARHWANHAGKLTETIAASGQQDHEREMKRIECGIVHGGDPRKDTTNANG